MARAQGANQSSTAEKVRLKIIRISRLPPFIDSGSSSRVFSRKRKVVGCVSNTDVGDASHMSAPDLNSGKFLVQEEELPQAYLRRKTGLGHQGPFVVLVARKTRGTHQVLEGKSSRNSFRTSSLQRPSRAPSLILALSKTTRGELQRFVRTASSRELGEKVGRFRVVNRRAFARNVTQKCFTKPCKGVRREWTLSGCRRDPPASESSPIEQALPMHTLQT